MEITIEHTVTCMDFGNQLANRHPRETAEVFCEMCHCVEAWSQMGAWQQRCDKIAIQVRPECSHDVAAMLQTLADAIRKEDPDA